MVVLTSCSIPIVAAPSGKVVPRARRGALVCLHRDVVRPRGAGIHCRWLWER